MSASNHTPVTFSREEAQQIRDLMGTPHARVSCPLCGEKLELQGPIAGDGTMGPIFQVSCRPCHRSAIITEAPGTRRPAG
jgi:hypothetical protein